jgi:hypothetical protein
MLTAALGWLGMGGTFVAYLLLARGRLASESLGYAVLNTVGGLLGGAASTLYGAWPSVASNVVWATVGMHSVVVALQRRDRWAADSRPAADEVSILDGAEDCLV